MIVVPKYQESQQVVGAPQSYFSINGRALHMASGGETWRAAEQAVGELSRTGLMLARMGQEERLRHDQSAALERLTGVDSAAMQLQTEQAQRLGGTALTSQDGKSPGVADTINAKLAEVYTKQSEGLSESQKRFFDGSFQAYQQRLQTWADKHEAEQRKVWQNAVDEQAISAFTQRAIACVDNPADFLSAQDGIATVIDVKRKREGWDDATTQKFTTEYYLKNLYKPAISVLIDKGDLKTARGFLKQFRPDFGEEKAQQLEERIKNKEAAQTAQAKAAREREKQQAEQAALRGTISDILSGIQDFPRLEEQKKSAFSRVDALSDPATRDKVRAEITRELAWRETRQDAADMKAVLDFQRAAREEGLSPAQVEKRLNEEAGANLSERARSRLQVWQEKGEQHGTEQGRAMTLLRAIDQSRVAGEALTTEEILAAGLHGDLSERQVEMALTYLNDDGGLSLSRLDDICLDLHMQPDKSGRVEAPGWLYEEVRRDMARNGLLGEGKVLTDDMLASSATRVWQRRTTALAAMKAEATPIAADAEEASSPSLGDAFEHGLQGSVSGLMWRNKLPDKLPPEDLEALGLGGRLVLSMGQILGDAPTLAAGGVIGALGGPAVPVTGPAGAVGLTEGTRTNLEGNIRHGTPQTFSEFAERLGDNLLATAKGMAVGGATGAAGSLAKTGLQSIGVDGLAQNAGRLGAETATMPIAGAAVEGRLPDEQDFINAAVLLAGMKGLRGAGKLAGQTIQAGKTVLEDRLRVIHKQTKIAPEQAVREAKYDPALLDDLLDPNKPLPEPFTAESAAMEPAYQSALRELYANGGAVKMVFRDTGVEPSLSERSQLRVYLDSLDPKDVKQLKLENPQDYLAVLKAITRKFFPESDGLRFRRAEDGRALDYEHFVGRDKMRDSYLATLPGTLKKQDIRVEFATPEGESKAYLIRKYFDAEIQRDVWDMLVIRDGELKTKIARTQNRGRNYIESQILTRARDTVSQPATTGGATENTSTPRNSTMSN